jgi:hypothetical protein
MPGGPVSELLRRCYKEWDADDTDATDQHRSDDNNSGAQALLGHEKARSSSVLIRRIRVIRVP